MLHPPTLAAARALLIGITCSASLARAALGDGPAWEAVAGELPARAEILRLAEAPGSSLLAAGARVVRRSGGRVIELRCTDPDGMGEIHDFARDPAGLAFVAAAHGLFVLSPDVEALQRVRTSDGAPRGMPLSVFVDDARRVWVATDEQVGVIDPSFGWGRTLTAADGLPGVGPYRLRGGRDGSLLVQTPAGLHRYAPDCGPQPVVTDVWIDGELAPEAGLLARAYGDALHLDAAGTASGGATFRWRLDGDHVWRTVARDLEIAGLHPGEHRIDVVAIDRDLNRSAPRAVRVSVGYPLRYDMRFLPPLVLGATAALALWAARRARGRGRAAYVRALLSTGLVVILGAQVLAGIVPHAKGWPFIGFSMYTNTYRRGSIVYDAALVGLDRHRVARTLDVGALGQQVDDRWQVLAALVDGGDRAACEWIAAFDARYPDQPLAGLQVRAERRCLTPDGPVRVAPLILSSYLPREAGDGR